MDGLSCTIQSTHRNHIFRELVQRKRCIIPADGYFEWHRNTKKPHRIRIKSQEVFALAGIYDTWKSPDGHIHTCSILTCEPNISMAGLHDRMPVIMRKEDYRFYLDHAEHSLDELIPVLQTYPGNDMYAYQVADIVGNVRNDVPECIEKLG
jgi:putative SOS response-associated peptidase YedK